MLIYFTSTEQEIQPWGWVGADWADQMKAAINKTPVDGFILTDSPEQADMIIFWEPTQINQMTWAPRLREHPLVQKYRQKAYVVTEEDFPLGFLPGLYCSLPRHYFDINLHRSWFYRLTLNPYIEKQQPVSSDLRPGELAFFKGASSHRCRKQLYEMAPKLLPHGIRIGESPLCRFNLNPAAPILQSDQLSYIHNILNCKFSLCPRGTGTSSFRLQESMALGRAPVIISDDWVPVSGIDWDSCSLRVRESQLDRLPSILRAHESQWQEMGDAAKTAYRAHLGPDRYLPSALKQLSTIHHSRGSSNLVGADWNKRIRRRQAEIRTPLARRIVQKLQRLFKRLKS